MQLEVWQLIGMLISFLGCVAGFGKVLMAQFDKRLDERFALQEKMRKEAQDRWQAEFEDLEQQLRRMAERLPNEYVRREDWIRFSATMDAKLDTLHRKIDGMVEKLYARG